MRAGRPLRHLPRLLVSGGGGVGAGGGTLQAGEVQQDHTRKVPLLCVCVLCACVYKCARVRMIGRQTGRQVRKIDIEGER